jgi:hypothetical protein
MQLTARGNSMQRIGKLAVLLVFVAVLSLCLILPVLADAGAPVGITETPTPPNGNGPPPVIPEASTLLLLGGSATGLAAYVGLQIRARRKS